MHPQLRSKSTLLSTHPTAAVLTSAGVLVLGLLLVLFTHSAHGKPFPPAVALAQSREPELFLPSFLPTPRNVTFRLGGEAVLRCAVENRGARTVVWRKASEPHPLTIGKSTYIPDHRVTVVHQTHSLEWNLQISELQLADDGIYECQVVVARDRRIRQFIALTVDERPAVRPSEKNIGISGNLFVERGETLSLSCNATGSEYPPDDIDWFKDGNKIKNSERALLTKDVNLSERTIVSALQVFRVSMDDAGTYICRTSDLQVTSAKVNILNTGTNYGKRESAGATSVTSYSYGQPPTSGHVTRVTPRNQSPVPPASPRLAFVTSVAICVIILVHHIT